MFNEDCLEENIGRLLTSVQPELVLDEPTRTHILHTLLTESAVQPKHTHTPFLHPRRLALAAAVIIAAILGVVYIWKTTTQKAAPGPAIVREEKPQVPPGEPPSVRELTAQRQLAAELEEVDRLFAAKDVPGLIAILDKGAAQAKIAAANYLAEIGDASEIAALERQASEWPGNKDNNPFVEAIKAIKARQLQGDANEVQPSSQPQAGDVPFTETHDPNQILCSGHIVDENDQPIAGVQLSILFHIAGETGLRAREAATDPQGYWQCNFPRNFTDLSIRLLHPDYISFHLDSQPDRTPSVAELEDGTNVMVLRRGRRISGIVRNQLGRPVEDALIAAGQFYRFDSNGIGEDCTTARTTEDGAFSIGGLPLETINFSVSAIGYAPRIVPVTVQDKQEPVVLTLSAGKAYRGQVVDRAGRPIEAVAVSCYNWRVGKHNTRLALKTVTDSQGVFEIRDVPDEGTVEFTFSKKKDSWLPVIKTMPADLSQLDRTVMYKNPVFAGRVVDSVTGQPLKSFQITTGVESDSAAGSINWHDYCSQIDSADGRFSEPLTGFIMTYPVDGAFYARINASGYLPALTPAVKLGDEYQPFEIRLVPAGSITRRIVDANATPVHNVEVVWVSPHKTAVISNRTFVRGLMNGPEYFVHTDANGWFELAPSEAGGWIAALHEYGYAIIESNALPVGSPITLTPWARIEGTILTEQNFDNLTLGVSAIVPPDYNRSASIEWAFPRVAISTPDFAIDDVPSIPMAVGKVIGHFESDAQYLEPQPGQTLHIELGRIGTAAFGTIILPPDCCRIQLSSPRMLHAVAFLLDPQPQLPDKIKSVQRDDYAWLWLDKDTVYELSKTWQKRFIPAFQDDGAFKFDPLPPGRYELVINAHAPLEENALGGRGVLEGVAVKQFTVEPGPQTAPVQMGEVRLSRVYYPDLGQAAPNFEAETFDGQTVRLDQFKGKLVLLDFWATWCTPCIEQMPALKQLHDKFSGDSRFVMLGLCLDWEIEKAKKTAAKLEIDWPQLAVGPMSQSPVVREYGVGGVPAVRLIDPAGVILAKDLPLDQLEQAITRALAEIPANPN